MYFRARFICLRKRSACRNKSKPYLICKNWIVVQTSQQIYYTFVFKQGWSKMLAFGKPGESDFCEGTTIKQHKVVFPASKWIKRTDGKQEDIFIFSFLPDMNENEHKNVLGKIFKEGIFHLKLSLVVMKNAFSALTCWHYLENCQTI